MSFVMYNREITHDSENKTLMKKDQLVVNTKYSFCCHLRETYVKNNNNETNAKARFETLKIKNLKLPPFVLNI